MVKVATAKKVPKQFEAFEKELKAIERMKKVMRGEKHYDASGVKTKDKLLGLDQLRKFAHGNTRQKLTLFNYGKEKTYQKRTIKAYKTRLENLIKRTAGGMTIKRLLAGLDRKKSKSGPKSPISGTSRKQRVKDIKRIQFVKMLGNIAHFRVSASGMTKGAPAAYQFQMQFPGWSRARALKPGIRGVEQVVQDPVLIHCSCKDFQFQYGFVATSAGYGIESEQSYPKIKNPKLQNTMCKHSGRSCEAILKGESGVKIALANAMKAQAKKKQNIDQPLWAKQPGTSKKEAEFKKAALKKALKVDASAKAKKRAEKGKPYKDFTKKEKDKLFKKLPDIVTKATKSKAKTVEKIVKDYAKKEKIDPGKAVRFARTGIQQIMEKHIKAAKGATKAVMAKGKARGDKSVETAKLKGDLIKAKGYLDKFGEAVYKQMLGDLSKETGKSVASLEKMAEKIK